MMASFAVQNFFSLMESDLFIFSFVSGDMPKILLPMFSSRIFMVSGMTLKSF